MEFHKFFFVQHSKDPSRQRRLDFVAIFIGCRDMRVKLESCRKTY